MMDVAYEWIGWVLIAIGMVGCFLPVLPGPPIAYVALFLALARGDHSSPGVSTLVVAGVVTAAVLVLDWIVPALGAKKFNCSRLGMFGCFLGTIVGLFFLPIGVVAGPFLGALAGEMVSGKPLGLSLKGAFGALLGYGCGVVLKSACCGFIAYHFWTSAAPSRRPGSIPTLRPSAPPSRRLAHAHPPHLFQQRYDRLWYNMR